MLTRRGLLFLLTGLCSAPLRALLAHKNALLDGGFPARIFRVRESAINLGAEYLRRAPAENDRQVLRAALDLPPRKDFSQGRALALRLAERHRDDFRQGEIQRIEGWILSRTELRLCALAYLTS